MVLIHQRGKPSYHDLATQLVDPTLKGRPLEEEIRRLMAELDVEIPAALSPEKGLDGRARTKELDRVALELEITKLPDRPLKLKWYQKPRVRSLITGLVLSIFAIGLYFFLFETHRRLGPLAWVLMGLGGAVFASVLVATIWLAITGAVASTGKKKWRFVAPGLVLGLVLAGIGIWLLWCSKQGFTYVDDGHVLPVIDTTGLWHHFQPVDFLRHGYRKLGEVVLIVGGAMSYSYNPYGLRRLRKLARGPRWYDKVEMFLRIPNDHDDAYRAQRGLPQLSGWQVLATFAFWQFVYAGFIVWIGLHFIHHFQNYNINNVGPSWLQFILEPLTGPTAYVVIGLVAGRAARRPVAPVLNELQRWRTQSFVAADKTIKRRHRMLWSPYQVERVKRTQAKGVHKAAQALHDRSNALVAAMVCSGLFFLGIWGLGLWVKIHYGAH